MTLILWIAVFAFLIQLVYWLLFYGSIKTSSSKPTQNDDPISIIVIVHNDAERIFKLIQKLSSQSYSKFELLIMDHGSTDLLQSKIQQFSDKLKINYFYIKKTSEGKKEALELAVREAKHSYLLLTDADCNPASNEWIKTMISNVKKEQYIVLGYSPYAKTSGVLNAFVRWEAWINALQSFGACQMGIPYTGVGRNLLYSKSLFDFKALQSDHLVSGDDDLLINSVANNSNCSYCLDEKAFVFTEAKKTYQEYFKQRRRHYSASVYYHPVSQFYLLMYFGSLFFFYVSIFILIFSSLWMIGFLLYFIRLSITMEQAKILATDFKENDLWFKTQLFEPLYLIHLLLQIPFIFFPKKQW